MSNTCSPGQYGDSGRCCNLCPKGKYISLHCTDSSATKCETCAHETYTEHDNYLSKCLTCTRCHEDSQYELKPCREHSDRQCQCKDGFYCTDSSSDHCMHCSPVKNCPPGNGVHIMPSKISDTVCTPCPTGTFNSVHDYKTPCVNHTNCENLGRHILMPGSSTNDTVCGDNILKPPVPNCYWMLPAGLWAGLVMTILIFVFVLLYLWAKRKSQQTGSTSQCSDSLCMLPPDVIKLPKSPEMETQDVIINNMKLPSCTLECDGHGMTTMTASEMCGHSASLVQCGLFLDVPSFLQSEPQEDEWPGS